MLGWQGMKDDVERRLVERTGADLATWAARSRDAGTDDEQALRAWLDARDMRGYGQMYVVMERFGYPDYLTAAPDELVDAQYADRAGLRPVLDAVLELGATLPGTTVQARKGYVALVARRQYALVRATTRTRVDLGLRLDGVAPAGRLLPAPSLGNDTIGVRVALSAPGEVDAEVAGWLERAHREGG